MLSLDSYFQVSFRVKKDFELIRKQNRRSIYLGGQIFELIRSVIRSRRKFLYISTAARFTVSLCRFKLCVDDHSLPLSLSRLDIGYR